MNTDIRRGDIVFVADTQQHSPHDFILYGNHPAVVVQNNAGNAHSQNTVVAFLTSSCKRPDIPTHFILGEYEGLRKQSMVEAEQLRTISKNDIIAVFDHLNEKDMVRLNAALIASLAIGEV